MLITDMNVHSHSFCFVGPHICYVDTAHDCCGVSRSNHDGVTFFNVLVLHCGFYLLIMVLTYEYEFS